MVKLAYLAARDKSPPHPRGASAPLRPTPVFQLLKYPQTNPHRNNNGTVIRHRLGIDHPVEPHNLVEDNDQGDKDQPLPADRQDQGGDGLAHTLDGVDACLLYTSPSPRD